MENLRCKFTREDREALNCSIQDLREYLLPVLKKKQNDKCLICDEAFTEDPKLEIHHTVYNPKVSIYELELLHMRCHRYETETRPMKMRCHPKTRHMIRELQNKGYAVKWYGSKTSRGWAIIDGIKKRFHNAHELNLLVNEIKI